MYLNDHNLIETRINATFGEITMKHRDYQELQRHIQGYCQRMLQGLESVDGRRIDSINITTRGRDGGTITIVYRDVLTAPLFGEIKSTEGDM